MWRNIYKNILLVAFGISLGLFLIEIYLRIFNIPIIQKPVALEHNGGLQLYRSHREGYPMHRIVPYSTYTHIYSDNPRHYFSDRNQISIVANNRGFRGSDFDTSSSPNVFKIAFLGDSFTIGQGVHYLDTYPEIISSMLNKHILSSKRAVSYNYGMIGFNTAQEYILLRDEVMQTHPDMIVLGYVLNDTDGPLAYEDSTSGEIHSVGFDPVDNMLHTPPPLYSMNIMQVTSKLLYQHRLSAATTSYYNYLHSDNNPNLKINMESLQNVIELCEERHIPLVVACFPVLYKTDSDYPFIKIHNIIEMFVKNISSKETTKYIDLFSTFKGMESSGLWVHSADYHPNERAHLIIAWSLYEVIRNSVPNK